MAIKVGNSIRGTVKLFDSMVATTWNGLQCFRNRVPRYYQSTSPSKALFKDCLASMSPMWYNYLTEQQRVNWNEYATHLRTQSKEELSRMDSGAGNIIPYRGKLMSGYNAFLSCAGTSVSVAHGWVGSDAPLAVPAPYPPLNVEASYDPATGEATVEWTDPWMDPSGPCFDCTLYVRAWVDIQRRSGFHPFQVVAYTVPSAEAFVFSHVRGSGTRGGPVIPIADLVGAQLRFQMDSVYVCEDATHSYGGISSFHSSVSTVMVTCLAPT